eukprot:SAG22_NODE_136_length_18095_cov_19.897255_13_plen_116_part_00
MIALGWIRSKIFLYWELYLLCPPVDLLWARAPTRAQSGVSHRTDACMSPKMPWRVFWTPIAPTMRETGRVQRNNLYINGVNSDYCTCVHPYNIWQTSMNTITRGKFRWYQCPTGL